MKPKYREIQTKIKKKQKFQTNPGFLRKMQLFHTNPDHWKPCISFKRMNMKQVKIKEIAKHNLPADKN